MKRTKLSRLFTASCRARSVRAGKAVTIKGHVFTCLLRSSPCSQGYLAGYLIRYTFCLFLHYLNLTLPLRNRLCALDCPSHGIFPHDDTIELRPFFSSANIVRPVWPPGNRPGKLGVRWPQEPAEGYSTAMAVCGRAPRHCGRFHRATGVNLPRA
jgi:hypothetical protein